MASWTCPFCQRLATLLSDNVSKDTHFFKAGNEQADEYLLFTRVVRCPNDTCNQYVLSADLWTSEGTSLANRRGKERLHKWDLIPESRARALPNYIPTPIVEDYTEACLIQSKSPKASATLARRALQGMIRDFWEVKIRSNRLKDEIDAIKDRVDPDVFTAIDAVRTVGNIGAHMEADINVIVDVDPGEARKLIELIELLIDEWYVARHKKKQRVQQVIAVAQAKDVEKQAARVEGIAVSPTSEKPRTG